jgi:hypothetical protein
MVKLYIYAIMAEDLAYVQGLELIIFIWHANVFLETDGFGLIIYWHMFIMDIGPLRLTKEPSG